MSDNDHLIRFEWLDFLVYFLYSTWSLNNTIFECISPLSFTFYFRSFLFFLCYTKFEKTNFLTNFIFLLRQLTTAIKTNWQPPHNTPLPLPATTDIIATAHSRTPAYFLSSANFAVATLWPPLTTSPPPTSNVAAAVYVDAVSTAANKN